nr:uncharacterized protein LOC111770642 [Equus caballus]
MDTLLNITLPEGGSLWTEHRRDRRPKEGQACSAISTHSNVPGSKLMCATAFSQHAPCSPSEETQPAAPKTLCLRKGPQLPTQGFTVPILVVPPAAYANHKHHDLSMPFICTHDLSVPFVCTHILTVPFICMHILSMPFVYTHVLCVPFICTHVLSVPFVCTHDLSVLFVCTHVLSVPFVCTHVLSVSFICTHDLSVPFICTHNENADAFDVTQSFSPGSTLFHENKQESPGKGRQPTCSALSMGVVQTQLLRLWICLLAFIHHRANCVNYTDGPRLDGSARDLLPLRGYANGIRIR